MKLLVCSNGTPQAEGAVDFAGLLAAGLPGEPEVTLVGISEQAGEQPALLASLVRSQEKLAERGVAAAILTQAGEPVARIVKLAEEQEFDLAVISGVRQPGALARPAKVYDLIQKVSTRLLLVGEARQQLRKILVCTAGGYQGRRAVRFTARLAQATGASVELFHVMAEPPHIFADMENEDDLEKLTRSGSGLARSLRRQQTILTEAGVPNQLRLRYGLVLEEVADEIEEGDFDLVVTGTHPTGGRLTHWMMGDMTRQLVEQVDRPILIVRTAGRAEGLLETMRKLLPARWRRKG